MTSTRTFDLARALSPDPRRQSLRLARNVRAIARLDSRIYAHRDNVRDRYRLLPSGPSGLLLGTSYIPVAHDSLVPRFALLPQRNVTRFRFGRCIGYYDTAGAYFDLRPASSAYAAHLTAARHYALGFKAPNWAVKGHLSAYQGTLPTLTADQIARLLSRRVVYVTRAAKVAPDGIYAADLVRASSRNLGGAYAKAWQA